MIKRICFLLLTGGMLLTGGCAPTVAEILEMHNKDLVTNNYGTSMPLMEELITEDEKNSHEDTPLWRLMVANARMLSGNENAVKDFDAAEDLFLANDRKGNNYASAMMLNDRELTYTPNSQERMFVSLNKAALYAGKNQFDAARTEFNRLMQYQENWLFERRKEVAESEAAVRKSLAEGKNPKGDMPAAAARENKRIANRSRGVYGRLLNNGSILGLLLKHCSFDLKNSGDINKLKPRDYQNAYATHFCGIFRWLNGDGGIDYLRDACRLKPRSRVAAADFSAADKNIPPRSEVWVYVEDGLCPIRREVRIDLPIWLVPYAARYVKNISIALPKLVYRNSAAQTYTVAGVPMEELENIDRLLKTEYDVYMYSAVRRELLRCLLKTSPQVALGIIRDKASNRDERLMYTALQYASAGYAAATTRADERTWSVLPKRVLVQRIKRPADGVIKLTADGRSTEIKVAEGSSIIIIRKVVAVSPFMVRQINFARAK